MNNWGKLYNIIKMITGVSAMCMSVEYYFHYLKWGKPLYILDLLAWFLFSVFMIGESFIALTDDAPNNLK